MIKNIIKRDGRKEEFDFDKIIRAIISANITLQEPCDSETIVTILDELREKLDCLTREEIDVETIQDFIVYRINNHNKTLAEHYNNYRNERTKIRDAKINGNYYDTILELVNGKQNDTSKENSNKDSSQIYVVRDLIAGETSKKLYRENVMSKKLKELHDKGIIHVHDCDYRLQKGITNCELTNIKDMLEHGTVINNKFIEPPKSLHTACTVTSQIIACISSSTYGGQTISISHLAPFIKTSKLRYEKLLKDNGCYSEAVVDVLLKKEIENSIQTLLYQLNTLQCTNGQSPFITLFLYPYENPIYKNETMILCKEILKQRIKGMKGKNGNYINPTFPKFVVAITETMLHDTHKDYEFTKLCAECVSKRMVPDFISVKNIKKIKDGLVIPPMGCRSFLHPYKNKEGNYEIYGRSNLGVISINLPYIALNTDDINSFKKKLGELIDYVCYEQYKNYQTIADSDIRIAPILYQYGGLTRFNSGKIEQAVGNMRASISVGYMGIAEVVERFGIKYFSEEGLRLGLDVIKFMYERVNENKDKYNIALSLYGTPAESLTTKFAKALKQFPIIPKVNDRDYITNSYHIQVEQEVDAFTKMTFESEFQKYSTGGCISYIEAPDIRNNPEAVIDVMEFIYDNMVYCEINTTSCSICYSCGFEGEIIINSDGTCKCSNCNETNPDNLYVIRRTCGYLGNFQHGSSKGRIADIVNRVKHL